MFGYKVNICLHTHVEQLLYCLFVTLCVVGEVLGLHYFGGHANPINAALKIIRMSKVVECDLGVVIHVGVDQAEIAC